MKISANAIVLVADGRKAIILRNAGDERFPNLTREWDEANQNPPTAAQGTDRPGRVNFQDRRSSLDQTDWHAEDEAAFAKRAAAALTRLARNAQTKHVVIVAPPRTLAVLRRCLDNEILQLVVAELARDLVRLPISEIEVHLDHAGTHP